MISVVDPMICIFFTWCDSGDGYILVSRSSLLSGCFKPLILLFIEESLQDVIESARSE